MRRRNYVKLQNVTYAPFAKFIVTHLDSTNLATNQNMH
jgi:hypothetical protein